RLIRLPGAGDAHWATLRLLHRLVSLCLCLVDEGLAVGARPRDGAERVGDLGWRTDLLTMGARVTHAGAVEIDDLLDMALGLALDFGASRGADDLEIALADDLAQRGLGGVFHRLLGAADVEDEVADADGCLAHLAAFGQRPRLE